jgi:hypothetical protein
MIKGITRQLSIIGLMLLLIGLDVTAQDFSYTTRLVAGRRFTIGEMQVVKTGNLLDVTYVVNDPNWSITKTYLHVTGTANGFPVSPFGVPDIQNFDYQTNHENVQIYKYEGIDVSALPYVYVSANANVTQASYCEVDTSIINSIVPRQRMFMRLTLTKNPAYFNMRLYDYGGNLVFNDNFFGNCVDLENPIYEGIRYFPYAVSSYSGNANLINCMVDKPQNLDLANYIINQDYLTKFGAGGSEVQAAIWTLLDDDTPLNGGSNTGLVWNQTKVDQIVADASAKGEGFIPSCDGYFAVLLDQGCKDHFKNNGNYTNASITVQQSIFWLPVSKVPNSFITSTGECANAWGIGEKFTNTGWGQYFLSE